MAGPSIWQRVTGIVNGFFQLNGPSGVGFFSASGVNVNVTTSNQNTLANLRVANPISNNDAVPLGYLPSAIASNGGVTQIRFAVAQANISSTTSIPSGAYVSNCMLDVTTAYNAGTISIGETAYPSLLMATGDNFPTTSGIYAAPQDTLWQVTGPVLATVTGAASGNSTVSVFFTTPAS